MELVNVHFPAQKLVILYKFETVIVNLGMFKSVNSFYIFSYFNV